MSETERIERVLELELPVQTERRVAELLDACFPDTFDGRAYFKQLPQARLLLVRGDELVGHLGLDFRIIRVGERVLRTLGVIDLCVRATDRRHGRGTKLLQFADGIARRARADQVILFADQPGLYLLNGYRPVSPATITWLAIDECASHGMLTRDFSGEFMVKSVAGAAFPEGGIDLLGYLF